jgi:hypothetical protein
MTRETKVKQKKGDTTKVDTTFQRMNCKGCKFADESKVGTGEPCCTYAFQLNVDNDVCRTRREETHQPVKVKKTHDIKDCRQYDQHEGCCLLYGHACSGFETCSGDFEDEPLTVKGEKGVLEHAATHKKTTKSKKTQPDAAKTSPPDKPKKTQKREKTSNYDRVDAGICPHCVDALAVTPSSMLTLDDEVAGKGDGVTHTCKKCEHVWYLNRQIHTCACRTCQKAKKKV